MTLLEQFNQDPFAGLTGVELIDLRPGYAQARMEVEPQQLNAAGICHGGAIFTLADMAFGAAVNSHFTLTVSAWASVTFLKPARKGDTLFATARELDNRKHLPFGEVRVTNQNNELIALFTSSGFRLEDQKIDADGLTTASTATAHLA